MIKISLSGTDGWYEGMYEEMLNMALEPQWWW